MLARPAFGLGVRRGTLLGSPQLHAEETHFLVELGTRGDRSLQGGEEIGSNGQAAAAECLQRRSAVVGPLCFVEGMACSGGRHAA